MRYGEVTWRPDPDDMANKRKAMETARTVASQHGHNLGPFRVVNHGYISKAKCTKQGCNAEVWADAEEHGNRPYGLGYDGPCPY